MSLAVDSTSRTGGSGAGPYTWSHTCAGDNRLLIVNTAHYHTTTVIDDVTYDGVSLTPIPSGSTSIGQYYVNSYYLLAPATGTHDIIITTSGGLYDFGAGAVSLIDVHQSTPFGTAVTATGISTTPSVVVSSAADELVVDGLLIFHGGTLAVGSGQTERWNAIAGSGYLKHGGSTEVGAASTTMSWLNSSSQTWAITAVPVKPAGSSSSAIAALQYAYRQRRLA